MSCAWTRSNGWQGRKGETSGQEQRPVERRVGCDGDALLLLVDYHGVASHTGRRSCFYRAVRGRELETIQPVERDPADPYGCDAGSTPHAHD